MSKEKHQKNDNQTGSSRCDGGNLKIEVLRAVDEWQRAGAYSVRIQRMNRQFKIPLREEFDEHDGQGTRYIVLLDDGYPVATCRFFEPVPGVAESDPLAAGYAPYDSLVMLGRMVVLSEYEGLGLGARTMNEAEAWIRELGYRYIGVDSRLTAVDFYKKLGYRAIDPKVVISGPFECVQMVKDLSD